MLQTMNKKEKRLSGAAQEAWNITTQSEKKIMLSVEEVEEVVHAENGRNG